MRVVLSLILLICLACAVPAQASTKTRPSPQSVALTFDDGPDPRYTPTILDILAQYKVHATFFVVGVNAKAHPTLIRAIRDGGHAIANHTYRHPDLTRLSSAQILRELKKTNEVIEDLLGEAPKCFRPPYGTMDKDVQKVAESLGLKTVRWTVDSEDFKGPEPEELSKRVLSLSNGGSVILMHDLGRSGERSSRALRAIIEGFQKRNIGFESICK